MLMFYFILAFLVFFLQSLLPHSSLPHVDLLTLFIVFVSLRKNFIVSVSLAILLGTSLDCYGMGPLGLQAGALLIAVVGVQFLRHHLNFMYFIPQVLGVAVITIIQSLVMALLLNLVIPVPVIYPVVVQQGLIQAGVTSLSAPIVLGLFSQLEKLWRRWLFIKA